jgi:hypothetical protein
MRLMSKLMTSAGVLALSTGLAAAAPAVVQQDLNLRAGPGTDYEVIAAMPAGTTVNVMGCEASWCRVAFGGTAGFASRGYLGLGGGVAVAPASPGYAYGGYAPRYGYGYAPGYGYDEGATAYGSYSPGYTYGYYGNTGYGGSYGYYGRERRFDNGERSFNNERSFNQEGSMRDERRGTRASTTGSASAETERATEVKGNNPIKNPKNEAAVANAPRPTAIQGNNPMRMRQSTANPNLPRTQGQAADIKGNNPMRIRSSTASSNASATTGAAPREGNRKENNR